MNKCPVKRLANSLLATGTVFDEELAAWQVDIDKEVNDTLIQAKNSPWPEASTLFDNVY
jgi:TPP-dependent pyruvate/acetoin dehydrogenase alpha subunit